MYVPRPPAMSIQSIIMIFLRRAFDWYSKAFFVSFVALVVYSTALSTWVSKKVKFHVILLFKMFYLILDRIKEKFEKSIDKTVPILFTISPWLSINCAISKNMSWSSVMDFSKLKNISCRFWISLMVCLKKQNHTLSIHRNSSIVSYLVF